MCLYPSHCQSLESDFDCAGSQNPLFPRRFYFYDGAVGVVLLQGKHSEFLTSLALATESEPLPVPRKMDMSAFRVRMLAESAVPKTMLSRPSRSSKCIYPVHFQTLKISKVISIAQARRIHCSQNDSISTTALSV